MADLKELAELYISKRRAHDRAAAEEAKTKSEMNDAKLALARAMIDAGLDKTTIGGVSFAPKRETKYSCPVASREELLMLLEDDGYRGAFTVNPNTLNTIMREMADAAEDGCLPERYAQILNDYEDIALSVRGVGRETV